MSALRTQAADRLEELVPHVKEIIQNLRTADPDEHWSVAYAEVYELRREIGYVLRDLGWGVPKPSDRNWHAE